MKNVIVANSNGTLIADILTADIGTLVGERDEFARKLKEDKKKNWIPWLEFCDRAMGAGVYRAEPVNGAEELIRRLNHGGLNYSGSPLELFAAGSRRYLEAAYEQNGLRGEMGDFYSVFDDALRGSNPVAGKTKAEYEELARLMERKGKMPVSYVSHKEEEAKLGAEVYGHGILIDPKIEQPRRERMEHGEIIVVPSLIHEFVAVAEHYLLASSYKR